MDTSAAELEQVTEHRLALPLERSTSPVVAVVAVVVVITSLAPAVARGVASLDELVKLATIEPDTATRRTEIDLDALAVGDDEDRAVGRTLHVGRSICRSGSDDDTTHKAGLVTSAMVCHRSSEGKGPIQDMILGYRFRNSEPIPSSRGSQPHHARPKLNGRWTTRVGRSSVEGALEAGYRLTMCEPGG